MTGIDKTGPKGPDKTIECDHGQLARVCEVCELRAQVEALRERNDEWERKASAWMASPQAGQWLDGYRELALRLNVAKAAKDLAYLERNQCVALITRMAHALGYWAGTAKTAIDGWSEDWHGCVYIDLPAGQVSWHYHDTQSYLFDWLPPYCADWDGHDTSEKYRRVLDRSTMPNARAEAAEAEVKRLRVDAEKFSQDMIEYGKSTALAEREECAKVCDCMGIYYNDVASIKCAEAIRTRGES